MDDSEAFWQAWDTLGYFEKQDVMGRCRGESRKEVAYARFVTDNTVKNNLISALRKMTRVIADRDEPNCHMNALCWRYGYELGKMVG